MTKIAFILIFSWFCVVFFGGIWLKHKTQYDQRGLVVWQETNKKLDTIIKLMQENNK